MNADSSNEDYEAPKLTHKKLKKGREVWVDNQNTVIYAKMTNGSVIKLKNKKIVYMRFPDKTEAFYDDKGRLTSVKFKDGKEFLYEDGMISKQIGSDGVEAAFDKGELVYCKLAEGDEAWLKAGKVVRVKLTNGKVIDCGNKENDE